MSYKCDICPRRCGVDRTKCKGFCQEGEEIAIAKVIEHFMWEEPCLADQRGTLAIFFSGCNLRCDYCQNHEISCGGVGKKFSIAQFAKLIEEKQKTHSSIDLVTPTHFCDALCTAFEQIHKTVPVIWNTNGYETPENIRRLSSFVDVFLTDFKYADDALAQKFSGCNNYVAIALNSCKEMCKHKQDIFAKQQMVQGVIIRHLVLPEHTKNSFMVLDTIKKHFPERKISLMSQFTPNGKSSLNRKLTAIEYKAVLAHANKLELKNGYIQDFDSAKECFVPNFD